MKTKKPKENHFPEILEVFQEIKQLYPEANLCKHLSAIAEEYGDLWGVSDKEFLFALTKYRAQLEMDVPHTLPSEEEIKKIVKDAMNLSVSSLNEEYEDQL